MSMLSLFAAATDGRVDAENGVLRGVRVISKGEAKGHSYLGEPIIIDDITLDEVVEASASFPDGVPVKLAHGTDIEELVGAIKGFVRDVDCVRGDLYLLKSHENYATIIEMAQTMPSNFGVSISFMNAPEPIKGMDMEPDGDEDDEDGTLAQLVGDDIVAYAARVCELYSADLVQAPACNPSLFSNPMSDTSATPEVLPEAPVEEVKVEETAPTEVPAEEVVEAPVEVPAEEVKSEEVKPEEPAVEAEEVPAPAELSRVMDAVKTDFEATKTELSRVTTELAAVRSELTAAQENLAIKDAQLVELNMLHRSVLSVMGLGASIEIPEISEEAPEQSLIERYESMPAGPQRLEFFQTHRRALEKAIAARLGN